MNTKMKLSMRLKLGLKIKRRVQAIVELPKSTQVNAMTKIQMLQNIQMKTSMQADGEPRKRIITMQTRSRPRLMLSKKRQRLFGYRKSSYKR